MKPLPKPGSPFTIRVRDIITRIPRGRVMTYGTIAACAGNPGGARQVARILHSSSRAYNLPWHRVVNRQGRISLPAGKGREVQQHLLLREGVIFNKGGAIDLDRFLWLPGEKY